MFRGLLPLVEQAVNGLVVRRPVARPSGGGGPKFQNEVFRPWRELGPNLEKVDKIYTRGENFSKKR